MRIISGIYKNRKIKSPKGVKTRPTSEKLREAFFNICQSYVEGAEFLDLFAGSGAMGLEALSRGAQSSTFIDSDKQAIDCIKENLQEFNIRDKGLILKGDVFSKMDQLIKDGHQYDIIYADPPYDAVNNYKGRLISFSEQIILIIDSSQLLKKGGCLFVEDSVDSQAETLSLQNLKPKKSRQMGRTFLQHYQN
jgi:16S rRNA (guanine966-N2)-methyltransferase